MLRCVRSRTVAATGNRDKIKQPTLFLAWAITPIPSHALLFHYWQMPMCLSTVCLSAVVAGFLSTGTDYCAARGCCCRPVQKSSRGACFHLMVGASLHDLKPDATTGVGATQQLACCTKNQYAKACVTAVATPRCPPRSSALFSKPSEGQSIGPRIVVTLPPVPAVPTTTAISVGKRGIGSCLSCNPG